MNWNLFKKEEHDQEKTDRYDAPEWCSLSNRIKEESNYTCDRCKVRTGRLRAHHKCYVKGFDKKYRDLWDYPRENFVCVCDNCHFFLHNRYGYKTFDADKSEDMTERIAEIKFDFDIGSPVKESTRIPDEIVGNYQDTICSSYERIPICVRSANRIRYTNHADVLLNDEQQKFVKRFSEQIKKNFRAGVFASTIVRTSLLWCMEEAKKNPGFLQELCKKDGFIHQRADDIF